MGLKAIETRFKGYRFRSRLEARWAVFFDALGIEWEYEKEGYDLGNGIWYLPDFWLPTFGSGMFAEVKGDEGDFSKAEQLCRITKERVWLCEGMPDFKISLMLEYHDGKVHSIDCVPLADQADGENRMYTCPGEDEVPSTEHDSWWGCTFPQAIYAARSARFEHGESR